MPVLNGSKVVERQIILLQNYRYEEIANISHSVVLCPHTPGTEHQPYRDNKGMVLYL